MTSSYQKPSMAPKYPSYKSRQSEGDQSTNIMCEVNPEHKKNVRVENGVKLLYLHLLKYLYGYVESALLWCDIYAKTLKSHGFLINPYDRCIANITIQD